MMACSAPRTPRSLGPLPLRQRAVGTAKARTSRRPRKRPMLVFVFPMSIARIIELSGKVATCGSLEHRTASLFLQRASCKEGHAEVAGGRETRYALLLRELIRPVLWHGTEAY